MDDRRALHVAVVGAGVIGLSVAAHLVELPQSEKLVVTLIAERFSPHTTSDRSGGWVVPPNAEDGGNPATTRLERNNGFAALSRDYTHFTTLQREARWV